MVLWKSSLTFWGYERAELMPRVLEMSSFLNLGLAVFNMLPIPPLDGSRVMAYILPAPLRASYIGLERFGLLLVIVFIYFVPGVREAVSGALLWLYEQLYVFTGGNWMR